MYTKHPNWPSQRAQAERSGCVVAAQLVISQRQAVVSQRRALPCALCRAPYRPLTCAPTRMCVPAPNAPAPEPRACAQRSRSYPCRTPSAPAPAPSCLAPLSQYNLGSSLFQSQHHFFSFFIIFFSFNFGHFIQNPLKTSQSNTKPSVQP